MTTLKRLLQTYEGLIEPSVPEVMRKVYGKRLSRIHWLTSRFVDYGICSLSQAQLLCYQLVVQKSRWRSAKRKIHSTDLIVQDFPQYAAESYAALYTKLHALASSNNSQEVPS